MEGDELDLDWQRNTNLVKQHFLLLFFRWLFGLGRLPCEIQTMQTWKRWSYCYVVAVVDDAIRFVCEQEIEGLIVLGCLLLSPIRFFFVATMRSLTFLWGSRVWFNISRKKKEIEQHSSQGLHVWPHHICNRWFPYKLSQSFNCRHLVV